MIKLERPEICCGCGACANICAHKAISMHTDKEGFLYPVVDTTACTDCGLCESVCPFANVEAERMPRGVFASRNNDESVREKSSSGGVFAMLAERTIAEGGVVFGARFAEDWSVIHDHADTLEGIKLFMGSKYVQSRLGDSYIRVRKYLKEGRKVLFSGTPCQISALRKFLRKEYDNLLLVDVVCHGVPSNRVWQRYLDELTEKSHHRRSDICSISFRDKRNGWRNYGMAVKYSDGEEFIPMRESHYMRLFLRDLSIRPSCYECRCRSGRSGADITLADFWGANKVLKKSDDDRGISLLMVWNKKGQEMINSLDIKVASVPYYKAFKYNTAIAISPRRPAVRDLFWQHFEQNGAVASAHFAKQIKWSKFEKWKFSLKKAYFKTKLKLRYNEDRNCNTTSAE